MNNTITHYLAQQRAPFAEVDLNEVDSLVLSTIAYLHFEKGAIGKSVPSERVPLPIALCGIPHDELLEAGWLPRMGGDKFIVALLQSPRFMELEVGYFVSEVSSHFEKQFCAITFFFADGSCYVAFRGTDNSLAGWKEDFNLTFMEEVPSQVSARTYLEDAVGRCDARLYVGGHSKGGNLAEYAALTCREQTFQKISRVFNHDGPGFAFKPSERINDPAYVERLSKTIPESSVFGMLMEQRKDYRIVKSSGLLFTQHASTHWHVADDSFVEAESLSPEAEVISGTLNTWAAAYEPDQREVFIDAVYNLFAKTNAESWSDMNDNFPANAMAILEAAANLPAEMRSTILGMLRDVAAILSAKTLHHALVASKQERS